MRTENPYSKSEIVRGLTEVEAEVESFFSALSEEEFVMRVDEGWTPAEHLQHLNIGANAVGRGLTTSKLLLRLRFGSGRNQSRSYGEIRRVYREELAQGRQASGRFVPVRIDLPTDVTRLRFETISRWGRVNSRLRAALEQWGEQELDRLRMPHPALGKITVREMLFFTLYHSQHHIEAAKRRLPRFA